ncbi:MAG: pilus assembly protein [Candidatus Dadabacteria bacterium]|nr:MAG: pilus assembly protein [Candidatus Dadabacteria bacterium]
MYKMYIRTIGKEQSEDGGVLIEAAFALPILLFGMFAFMWVGFMFNAKTALTSSLSKALRLGVTRGKPTITAQPLIRDIEDLVNTGTISDRLRTKLLTYNVDWSSQADEGFNKLTEVFQDINGKNELDKLPREYLYALVYMYQGMKIAIGSSLKYPCNPDNPDGQGCLECKFLNPAPSSLIPNGDLAPNSFVGIPSGNYIGMQCRFRPSTFILEPAIRLLNLISGNAIVPKIILTRKLSFGTPGN